MKDVELKTNLDGIISGYLCAIDKKGRSLVNVEVCRNMESYLHNVFKLDSEERLKLNELSAIEDKVRWIGELEVDKEVRGQGYAKMIMEKIINICNEGGVEKLYLHAHPFHYGKDEEFYKAQNKLIKLYEGFGFKAIISAMNTNPKALNKRTVVIMELDLTNELVK